jgi:hypothetical protein
MCFRSNGQGQAVRGDSSSDVAAHAESAHTTAAAQTEGQGTEANKNVQGGKDAMGFPIGSSAAVVAPLHKVSSAQVCSIHMYNMRCVVVHVSPHVSLCVCVSTSLCVCLHIMTRTCSVGVIVLAQLSQTFMISCCLFHNVGVIVMQAHKALDSYFSGLVKRAESKDHYHAKAVAERAALEVSYLCACMYECCTHALMHKHEH